MKQEERKVRDTVLKEPLTWNQLTHYIESYQLDKLGRSKEQLQAYRNFKKEMAQKNISITTNLMINEMHWLPKDTDPHLSSDEAVKLIKYNDPRPFANPGDVFIALNKFPYYIKEKTIHLLVWVKFPMLPDPKSEIGDIDDHTKAIIEKYIHKTFVQNLGIRRDHLVWWKNYTRIQSIKAIPHIHVLINLENDTNGSLEKKLMSMLGTAGVMLDYPSNEDPKL